MLMMSGSYLSLERGITVRPDCFDMHYCCNPLILLPVCGVLGYDSNPALGYTNLGFYDPPPYHQFTSKYGQSRSGGLD